MGGEVIDDELLTPLLPLLVLVDESKARDPPRSDLITT